MDGTAADMLGAMRRFGSFLALVLALAPAALAQTAPFRIVNRTDAAITALHAVRATREDWGPNLLTRGPLPPTEAFQLRANESAGCRFNIRLVLSDGREVVVRDHDICANRIIEAVLATPQTEAPAAAAPGAPPPPVAAAQPAVKPPPLPPPTVAGVPPPPPPAPVRPNPAARVSSGTGFVIGRDLVMTNHHVVEACRRILVRTHDNRLLEAAMPARVDSRRDLAVLSVAGEPGPALTFRTNPPRRGDAVVTYGFPLTGVLASGPTLTTGEVSALAGLGDNPQQIQISAPVQAGNSGGPLLDRQGNVIAVIVSKLDAVREAQRTGDIPQNVNFAVRATEALEFLRRIGVTVQTAESRGAERSAAEVGEMAHRSTVLVRCER